MNLKDSSRNFTKITIAASVIVVLIAAQIIVKRCLVDAYIRLDAARAENARLVAEVVLQRTAVSRHKEFEEAAAASGMLKNGPQTTTQLYSMVEETLKRFKIVNAGVSPVGGTAGTGVEKALRISVDGEYYNLLKALAALREAKYVLRVAELSLNAATDGKIAGTLVVRSVLHVPDIDR